MDLKTIVYRGTADQYESLELDLRVTPNGTRSASLHVYKKIGHDREARASTLEFEWGETIETEISGVTTPDIFVPAGIKATGGIPGQNNADLTLALTLRRALPDVPRAIRATLTLQKAKGKKAAIKVAAKQQAAKHGDLVLMHPPKPGKAA